MVKALVAFGGKEVGEEQIIDVLWPEADGDAAHRLFEITLYRLRQLIGFPEVVQLRDGRFTLNPKYCWVGRMGLRSVYRSRFEPSGERSGGPARRYSLPDPKGHRSLRGSLFAGDTQEFWDEFASRASSQQIPERR